MRKSFLIVCFLLAVSTLFSQKNDSINVFELSLQELMNLEVYSANKKAEPITNIPSSIVIITRKEIQEAGWQNLEEILNHVPGMYMINDYLWFGTSNFGVRGFFSTGSFNTMIVMVNGVSQKEDWYNSFPFTKINVPVEAIDRIEVIRGPMSVVYGNNAFLGAINIVTNESEGTLISTQASTNKGYKAFARLSGKADNLSYTINGSMYGDMGIDAAYSEMMSDPYNEISGLPSWNLSNDARTYGQLADHRKYFNASLKYKSFYFETSQTLTSLGVIDYYPGVNDGHIADIQSANNVIGYQKDISEQASINIKAGYYSFRNRLDYNHNSDTTSYGFNDIFSDAFDAEVNLNFNPFEHLSSSFGLYYRHIIRDRLVVDAPNISQNYNNLDAGLAREDIKINWAAFAQSTYSFRKNLRFIAGLRIEQTPQYDISYMVRFDPQNNNQNYLSRKGTYLNNKLLIIPRAAILYDFSDIHHIKIMYGMAVREPSIGENMDVVRYPDRPQLKPAYMQTIEINYIGLPSNNVSLNISVFYNHVNNLISRTNTLQNGEMQLFNTNSGELQTLGSELSFLYMPNNDFSSKISLTYQKSANLQEGYEEIELEYAPNFLAYATISYRFLKKHTIGFSAFFTDHMKTYWNPDNIEGPEDNRTSIDLIHDGDRIGANSPPYFVGNINLRFNDLFKQNIYCTIYAHNIFNKKVIYPTTRSNDVFDMGTIGYGRKISLGMGINF